MSRTLPWLWLVVLTAQAAQAAVDYCRVCPEHTMCIYQVPPDSGPVLPPRRQVDARSTPTTCVFCLPAECRRLPVPRAVLAGPDARGGAGGAARAQRRAQQGSRRGGAARPVRRAAAPRRQHAPAGERSANPCVRVECEKVPAGMPLDLVGSTGTRSWLRLHVAGRRSASSTRTPAGRVVNTDRKPWGHLATKFGL